MAKIDDLIIDSTIKHDKVDKGLKQVGSKISSAGSLAMAGIAGAAGGAAMAGVTAIFDTVTSAASTAINKITELTSRSFTLADDIQTQADLLGLSADRYLALTHAALGSEVATGDLNNAINKLNLNLAEAATTGKGATAEALAAIGLSANDLIQQSPEEAMKRIADGLSDVGNHAQKSALMGDIFGQKLGPKLAILLGDGRQGIDDLLNRFGDIGPAIDQVDFQRANLFNEAWDKVVVLIEKVGLKLASELGPFLADAVEGLVKWSGHVFQFWDLAVLAIKEGVKWAARLFDWLLENTKTVRGLYNDFLNIQSGIAKFALRNTGFAGAADMIEQADSMRNALHEMSNQKPGEQFINWLDSVDSRMANLTPKVNDNRAALDALADAQQKLATDSKTFIVDLEKTILTFGMSSNQIKIWELAQRGADRTTIQHAMNLVRQIEAMEAGKKAREDFITKQKQDAEQLRAAGKATIAATRTPLEQFHEKVAELRKQFSSGALGTGPAAVETFQRALNQQLKGLAGKIETPERKLLGATSFNSVEGRSLMLQARLNPARSDPARETAVGIRSLVQQNRDLYRLLDGWIRSGQADPILGVGG